MGETCSTCGEPAKGGMCEGCIAFEMDHDDNDCGNCGGEGFVYDCFEEWACVDPESGCDLCMRRCDWCTPLKPAQLEERTALQQVLADALAQSKDTGGHNAD